MLPKLNMYFFQYGELDSLKRQRSPWVKLPHRLPICMVQSAEKRAGI